MNFHLTPNPEKSYVKIFGKTKKNLIPGDFGPILSILGKKYIFGRTELCQFLRFIIISHDARLLWKTPN